MALHNREGLRCKDCGRPLSECSDPERDFYPFRTLCFATMEREAAVGLYMKLHEKQPYHNGDFSSWAAERTREHPFHMSDGVKFGVADSDVAAGDAFTTDPYARPSRPLDREG